jgi:uncharacterized membrane protein YjjB (DUF3815 family)
MVMEVLLLFEKAFWAGIAALGFGVLFNVPVRTLFAIWGMGALGGLTKYFLMEIVLNIILSSLVGASLVGIISIPLAHKIHSPPLIFSIPAVIPMVPGALAYKMMLGLMKISVHTTETGMDSVMVDTLQAGMKAMFILLSLAVGVAVPMLLTRKESAKRIRIKL